MMKLIATVTLVTKAGEIAPGGVLEIEETAEADRLVSLGFAAPAGKAAEPELAAPAGKADKP